MTQSIEGGGWGGRPYEDGESASVSVCQGDVHNAPIEKMELRWPIVVESPGAAAGLGWPGQVSRRTWCRGRSAGARPRIVDARGHRTPSISAMGCFGGAEGLPSDSLLRLPEDASFTHVDLVRHEVPAGTTAVIVTAGGGGWGDPLERDAERVAADVKEGYVSEEAARDQYGVVLKAKTVDIDAVATTARRAELARTGQDRDA